MTAPSDPTRALDASTLTELNELLQVDHDAVAAYTLAIRTLANVGRRETIMRFRSDHERHIEGITRVVRRAGGTPVDPEAAADGAFARAMRGLGEGGGDRAVMAAFDANEAQTCERYTRAATRAGEFASDVRDLVTAAADDEARHYEWASEQLASMAPAAAESGAALGRAAESMRARLAESAERLEAATKRGMEAARRGASAARARLPERMPELDLERPSNQALAVGAVAAGLAFAVTVALARTQRRR